MAYGCVGATKGDLTNIFKNWPRLVVYDALTYLHHDDIERQAVLLIVEAPFPELLVCRARHYFEEVMSEGSSLIGHALNQVDAR